MILDFLTIASIVLILTTSKLLKPFREFLASKSEFLGKLFSCQMCLGVWVGLGYYFIPEPAKEILYYTFIGSIASFLLYLLTQLIKKE